MHWKAKALLLSALATPLHAQTFDTATVKPAPPEAPVTGTSFMIGLGKQLPPRGLLTMTAPLAIYIIFAYNVEDEVEARAMRARLPEWARTQKYTIAARPPDDTPNMDQLRAMMRALLEDRFALQAHRDKHTGAVNALVLAKPGTTGPNLKPHTTTNDCVQRSSNESPKQEPAPTYCGLELHQTATGTFHVSMTAVTLPEACTLFGGLAGVVGGRSMDQVVDNTGLQGKWDLTLDFAPEQNDTTSETNGPSFSAALEKQLGLRLNKSTGPIEDLIIDHITQPTAD